MSEIVTYRFPSFLLHYIAEKGDVITAYNDNASCRVSVNSEDIKHAALLGIQPGDHKLLHEIVHQQLAIAMGLETCPIVRAQALGQPMPENHKYLEDMIMALSYMAMWKPMPYNDWWQRIGWVQQYTNPFKLVDDIYDLYMENEVAGITIFKQ